MILQKKQGQTAERWQVTLFFSDTANEGSDTVCL